MEPRLLEADNKARHSLQRGSSAAANKSDLQAISARSVATTLYRYKWLSLFVFLSVATATIAVVLLLPNKYSSRMKILVRTTRPDTRLTADDTKGTSPAQDVSEADINTEVALVTSRDLLQDLVQKTNLVELADENAPKGVVDTESERVDRAVGKLEKHLEVSPLKKSNIIEISYTSDSPERATDVLQELAALYMDKHLRLHSTSAGYDLFREQAEHYGKQLREDETRLAEFEKSNNLVAIDEQKQTALKSLADAQTSFHEADASLGENQKRVVSVQEQLKKVSPRVLTQSRKIPDQYSAERLNTMMVELQNRRTELLTKFRPDDRRVQEVDKQIKTTRDAYDAAAKRNSTEEATDLNPLRQKLETDLAIAATNADALRPRRETFGNQIAQYQNTLDNLENATQQHEALQRAVKQSEENYILYSRKTEEARITNAMDRDKISNVEIAEAATFSSLPSSPNRLRTLALGLFLASFLGIGCAFGAEFMRNTVATPLELEALTGYPVLASLPQYRKRLGGG